MTNCMYLLTVAFAIAVLAGTGCQKSPNSESGSTNAASSSAMTTNGMVNTPPADMTNMSTNMPAMPANTNK